MDEAADDGVRHHFLGQFSERLLAQALGLEALALGDDVAPNMHVARPRQAKPIGDDADSAARLGDRSARIVERRDRLDKAKVVSRCEAEHGVQCGFRVPWPCRNFVTKTELVAQSRKLGDA
jgi:hypothetical protein